MNGLALTYEARNQPELAIPLLEEAQKLCKARLGADNPITLTTGDNLAMAYGTTGKVELALPLLEESLKIRKDQLGPDHPLTLACMNNLAMAYRAAGTLELAVPLMKETLKLTRSIRGGDHHDTLTSINNLAAAYVDDGNIELALPLMREAAVEIETRRFQHIYAERIVNNLIRSQEFLKQFDQAEPWRRKWLTVVKSQSGVDSLGYAGELAGLGLNLLQRQKWTDAEAVLHDCLEIRRKEQADDPTTFDTQSMLGGALLGQKKYADAEPLLLAGYEGLKNNEQVMASQSKSSLIEHRLVDLYEATGKRDDAAGWRKEFEATEAAAELSPKP